MWGTLGSRLSNNLFCPPILHSDLKVPDTKALSASTCESGKRACKMETNMDP